MDESPQSNESSSSDEENKNVNLDYNFIVHGKKRKYTEKSLYLFDSQNLFRQKCLWLTEWKYFHWSIIVIILLNTILLCFQDFSYRMNQDSQDQGKSGIIVYFEYLFSLLFILEFLLKIIAKGFVMDDNTYLKNSWNVLDFIVVVSSTASFLPGSNNFTAIRTLRILRPLRSLNQISGLKIIISALIDSIPALGNVLVFLIFIILLFAILGLHLFAGLFYQRCRMTEFPVNGTWEVDPNITQLCHNEINKCPTNRWCGNPWQYNLEEDDQDMDIVQLNYGYTTFDNIALSFFTVSQVLIDEEWIFISQILNQVFSEAISDFYFIFISIIGSFYIMNLIIAVFTDTFSVVHIEKKQLMMEEEEHVSQSISLLNDNDFYYLDIRKLQSDQSLDEKQIIKQIRKMNEIIKDKLFKFISSMFFILFINACIILNTIVLALDKFRLDKQQEQIMEKANFFFTIIFILELTMQIWVFEIRKYFQNTFHQLDALIVIISIIDHTISFFLPEGSHKHYSVLLAFRALRLFRIFKLAKTWHNLRHLLETITTTTIKISQYMLLLLLFYTIFSLLGMEFFAYKVLLDNSTGIMHSNKHKLSSNNLNEYGAPRLNFDNFFTAFITTFTLSTGEDWVETMHLYFQALDSQVIIAFYFFAIKILGKFVLLKLYLAILINKFSQIQNRIQEKFKNKHVLLQAVCLLQNTKDDEKNKKKDSHDEFNEDYQNIIKNKASPPQSARDKYKKQDTDTTKQIENGSAVGQTQQPKRSQTVMVPFHEMHNINFMEQQQPQPQQLQVERIDTIQITETFNDEFPNDKNNNKDDIGAELNQQDKADSKNKKYQMVQFEPDLCIYQQQLEMEIAIQSQNQQQLFLEGISMHIFPTTSYLRNQLFKLIQNPYFDNVIMGLIIFSSLTLSLERPDEDPNSQLSKILFVINLLMTFCFFIEMMSKIICFGFINNGENSYLKNLGNVLDFSVVMLSLIDITPFGTSSLKKFKILRSLRVLRPIRIISRSEGLKLALSSILRSLENVFQLSLISLLIFIIFGIFGVNFLKGKYYYCDMTNIDISQQLFIHENIDCFDYGGDWVNQFYNFDDSINSLIQLFTISLGDGWSDIMWLSVDSTEVNKQPKQDTNFIWTVYHIIFINIGCFFLLNIFAGVIVDSFKKEQDSETGYSMLTVQQQDWVNIQIRYLDSIPEVTLKLEPSASKFKRLVFEIINNEHFEAFIMVCVLANTIIFMLKWHGQSIILTHILNGANLIFLLIFTLEAASKIFFMKDSYFNSNWNRFDFFIVCFSYFGIFSEYIYNLKNLGSTISVLRIFRILRILRLIKRISALRTLILTFIRALPSLSNIAALQLLTLYIYSLIGMNFFIFVMPSNNGLTNLLNFSDFTHSFYTLYLAASGQGFPQILQGISQQQQPNYACISIKNYEDYSKHGPKGCGYSGGFLFLIAFMLQSSFIIMNLFLTFILDGYAKQSQDNNSLIQPQHIEQFQQIWKIYDPLGTGFIQVKNFYKLLSQVQRPLGWLNSNVVKSIQKRRSLQHLKLPIYKYYNSDQYYIFYYDVLEVLVKRFIYINYGVDSIKHHKVVGQLMIYKRQRQAFYCSNKYTIDRQLSLKRYLMMNKFARRLKHAILIKKQEQNEEQSEDCITNQSLLQHKKDKIMVANIGQNQLVYKLSSQSDN